MRLRQIKDGDKKFAEMTVIPRFRSAAMPLAAIVPPSPSPPASRWRHVVCLVLGIGAGWLWVIANVAAMIGTTDMAQLGPGMAIFNHVNGFATLPDGVRASLALLCAPVGAGRWSVGDGVAAFAMWEAMVLAMMLPSAAPMLAALADRLAGQARPRAAPILPMLGYLTVWTGFSVLATAVQGGLAAARLMAPAMGPLTTVLAGTTLIAAGLYQFTPQKRACLARCRRPPAAFPPTGLQPLAIWRLGVVEGLACLGCCWALMAAMFAAGVMNIVWIVLLGSAMVLERTGTGPWTSRLIGLALVLAGGGLLALSPVGARLAGFA